MPQNGLKMGSFHLFVHPKWCESTMDLILVFCRHCYLRTRHTSLSSLWANKSGQIGMLSRAIILHSPYPLQLPCWDNSLKLQAPTAAACCSTRFSEPLMGFTASSSSICWFLQLHVSSFFFHLSPIFCQHLPTNHFCYCY